MFIKKIKLNLSRNKVKTLKNQLFLRNFKLIDHEDKDIAFISAEIFNITKESPFLKSGLTIRGQARWQDSNENEIYALVESNIPLSKEIKEQLISSSSEISEETILNPFIFNESGCQLISESIKDTDETEYYLSLTFYNENKSIKSFEFSANSSKTKNFTPKIDIEFENRNDEVKARANVVNVSDLKELKETYSIELDTFVKENLI